MLGEVNGVGVRMCVGDCSIGIDSFPNVQNDDGSIMIDHQPKMAG